MIEAIKKESKQRERPTTLDIISVNGKWGQIVGVVNSNEFSVKWLSDNTLEYLNLEKYELKKIGSTVSEMEKEFEREEIQNIYYDPDNKDNNEIKLNVVVFGQYTKT